MTTDLDKNAPRQPLRRVAVMANLVASLAIVPRVMRGVMVLAKVLHRAVHAWVMRLSARNAMRWSQRKTPCAVWPHRPMAKC